MYEGCKEHNPSATGTEPLTCGTDEDYKNEAAEKAAEIEANNPGAAEAEANKMLDDLLENMPSSGMDDMEALIAKIASIL